MRGGAGCFCGTEPDVFAGCLGAGESRGSGLFVVASLIIMHMVAWAEAYNP